MSIAKFKNKRGHLKDALFSMNLSFEDRAAILQLADEMAVQIHLQIDKELTQTMNRVFIDCGLPRERAFRTKYRAGGIYQYTWTNAPEGVTETVWRTDKRRSNEALNRWADTLELIKKHES